MKWKGMMVKRKNEEAFKPQRCCEKNSRVLPPISFKANTVTKQGAIPHRTIPHNHWHWNHFE